MANDDDESVIAAFSTSNGNGKGKGKGKERAIEPTPPTTTTTTSADGMFFGVRFTEGEADLLELWVEENETVRDVKRKLRFLRPSLKLDGRPRRLRLIQLGRLLTDGTKIVPYTAQLLSRRAKLVETEIEGNAEALIHGLEAIGREMNAFIPRGGRSSTEIDSSSSASMNRNVIPEPQRVEEDKTIWLHCSVGEAMEDDEIEGERIQVAQIKPLQGLDRMIDAGFTPEEIANMREEFRATAAATYVDGDEDEHARALEDQWMEGMTGQNEAVDTSSAGFYTTLLTGTMIGFFFLFLPFFFFRTQIFSRRLQISIVLGCFINLLFGILRAFA